MLAKIYEYMLMNVQLSLLIVAVILILLNLIVKQRTSAFEIIYQWISLLPLGLTLLFGFVVYVFFPDFSLTLFNFPTMPTWVVTIFGVANLGFGLIAVCSVGASCGFRLASVLANTIWLWGILAVCLYSLYLQHCLTIQCLSSWHATIFVVPLILIICLLCKRDHE